MEEPTTLVRSVRLPPDVDSRLARFAENDKRSISNALALLVAEALDARGITIEPEQRAAS